MILSSREEFFCRCLFYCSQYHFSNSFAYCKGRNLYIFSSFISVCIAALSYILFRHCYADNLPFVLFFWLSFYDCLAEYYKRTRCKIFDSNQMMALTFQLPFSKVFEIQNEKKLLEYWTEVDRSLETKICLLF